ncbi:MAG: SBBP repeat-containing protein, partial [Dolichospermum circinale Clear-D4]|nr:SBBP repeat-containing protein [Dolichospermum circinale Clear-D4]
MANISWKNGVNGNFGTAANWNPGTVPTTANIAQINLNGTYSVLLNLNRTLSGLTLGGSSGTQTLNNNGFTLTLNGASTVGANGVLNLTSGTINGTGALTVSGKLNWSGGTLSGTGKKTISGALNLSNDLTLSTTTLETTGTTVWTGNGTLNTSSAAIWNNTSTGTIDLQSDADFSYNNSGTKTTFNNAGTFTKSNGTTTDESYISGFFNNTGTVQVKAGTLNLSGGGTNTGSFSIDAGATLRITAGYNFNTGNSITGAGNFNIESGSGTTTVNAASTWSAPVNLISGTLTGAGALTISNKLNWSGGTLSGTGKKTISGALNLSNDLTLSTTTLETTGTTIWTGNGTLYTGDGAIWNNTSAGTIDLQNDADFVQNSNNKPTFNNAGTFTKSNGTTTNESYIDAIFNNTGTVQVKKGTLNLSGGGSNSGAFSIDSGATLKINNTYNFDAGNSITGAGNFNIESGTTTVNAASTWSAPVNLIGATLTGAGALTISNQLNWTGGGLSGTGKKTVSGTLNLSGLLYLGGTTLETSGATIWTGSGHIIDGDGGIWNNTSTGTIDLQNDVDFVQNSNNKPTFNNAGTFTKSNGTTTDESSIGALFNNTGTVKVKAGTLSLIRGGTNTGSFSIDAGATLRITADYNFNTGTNITGVGNFVVSYVTVKIVPAFNYSGAVFVNNSGNLDIGAASTWSAPVNLISGTLTGAGALTISDKLNWNSGTLSGTGKKTVSGTLNLISNQYSQHVIIGTTLETTGATVWTGNGTFYAKNAAIWNNTSTGTIDLQNDADFSFVYDNPISTFNNAGTFTKSNGTTTDDSFIDAIFNNTGTVQVKAGTLRLIGGGTRGTNTGNFSIDAGATLRITADYYNFDAGNSVTGAGNFNIESGIATTVNAASTWSAPVNLISGTLTGAGALTISNQLNWSGGGLSGTGKKTVSGTLNLSGEGYLGGTTLETSGATIWTGSSLYAGDGAIWNNTSTGTIDLQNDSDFSQWTGNQTTFNNAGTFTKSNGTTTDDSYISGLFNNTGTVQVNKGRLRFTGGYTQTAGTTNLSGGSLTFENSPLNLQGGNLAGIGTITGNVNNTGGQINPGNTIGTLTVAGDYSQTGTGTVNLELGSATSFDKLNITGAADVGGILKLNLTNGYTPTIGTKFTVLTYSSATAKSFNTIQGIDISSNLAFAPTSTGNNLILEVVDQVKDLGTINFTNPQSVTDFVGDTDLFDFYRFNITTASNVQVKLTNLTANADVWLVDGLGRTIAQGVKTGTANEVFNWAVDTGTYYVKVFRPAAGNNTNYDLQVATSTAYWPVQFGTSGQDQNSGVSNDRAGSVFAAGYTNGAFAGNTNAGNYDGYITKYNPDGSPAWIKQFGTSGTDYALGTGNDNAGNVYAAGYTNGAFTGATNLGSNDGFITKYTAAGTLAWVKQFGTAADDTSVGISVDSNGNSYVIGKTYGAFAGNVTQGAYDAYIAKYDTNGTQTWIKQFGTNQDDEAIGVSLDSNDNIYVLGATAGAFAGNTNASGLDVFVSKYNSSGTQAWVKQLGSSGNNYANINGISTDSTGNVFITGYTDGAFSGNTSLGSYDGFVAKYSTTGTLAWVKQFGTTSDDYSIASKTDSAGNTYVAGWTSGQLTGNTALGGYDGFLAKYNTSGTRLWVKQFGTSSNDYANGLSIDNLGNIYISGWTDGSFPTYTNQGGQDSYIALFDTNGNQLSIPAIPAVITVAATDANAGETATGITPNPGTFTLTRTGDLTQAITVNYTLSGSATNGTDYSSLLGTVNFAAGASSATVTVTPTDDNIFEGTETAILTLATGAGYILGTTTSATVNITDNDLQPSISINDVSVTEGNSGTTNATFTLTLSHPSSQPITVNYATADGTATTADLDYNAATFTVTFAPGETSKTVNVAVVGDIKSENPETFTVNLSNATNATITKAQGVGTITNDDLPIITLAATDSNAGETAIGVTANPGTFTLTRTGDLTQAITVNYTLSGSATNGTDYSSLPGTVNFAAGVSSAIVTVTPTDDNIFEGTETAILTLTTGTGYALNLTTSAVVNIADNDLPGISLALSPASVVEDGPTNLVYTFTRTGTTANALTVNYGVGGNATFNTDYTQTGAASFTATTGNITFAAGSSTATLTVDPTADTTVETNETVVLTLATAPGYTINTPAAVIGTITNDDSSALPVISVAATDASAAETATGITANPGQFTLTRLGGNINQAVTVNYTLTGTATNGTDYTSLPTSVTFAAGSSTAIVTVTPTNDTIFEATETAILTLATGTGYTVSTTNTAATVNIADNDLQPTINLSANQTIVEGNTNPQNVSYTVTLSNASTQAITVQYATANGTAIAGSDYTSASGTLTFNPGIITQVINIPILNDSLNEANETFTLNLTSATNATLGTAKTATTTITD